MDTKIRPIRNQDDCDAMIALIDSLIDAAPGTEDRLNFDIVSDLVWAWEKLNVEMLPPGPVDAIDFRLEQLGLSRSALEPILGSETQIGEIFAGKKEMTLDMVRALHDRFDIPFESLVAPILVR